jgi:hypothetical protein
MREGRKAGGTKTNAGVLGAGTCVRTNPTQRIEFDATCEEANPTFHEAGTWRGSDIAAAATIVSSNSRRAHMSATSK